MVFVICGARWPHALQVLHSGSNGGMGETRDTETMKKMMTSVRALEASCDDDAGVELA
jgi:hypothetical protein